MSSQDIGLDIGVANKEQVQMSTTVVQAAGAAADMAHNDPWARAAQSLVSGTRSPYEVDGLANVDQSGSCCGKSHRMSQTPEHRLDGRTVNVDARDCTAVACVPWVEFSLRDLRRMARKKLQN
jgi:hypothetical protein